MVCLWIICIISISIQTVPNLFYIEKTQLVPVYISLNLKQIVEKKGQFFQRNFYKNGILLNENHPYIIIADVYQFILPLDQNDAPAKQISNFLQFVEL